MAAGLEALDPLATMDDAGLAAAAEALRTTDSVTKMATTTIELLDGDDCPVRVTVSGIAKGVGMIHPNMATMLSIVLTDAAIEPADLWGLLRPAAARTWDQLSVDGDTSTNDTVFVLASGVGGARPVAAGTPEAAALGAAIEAVARDLARQQAADGEGAATLITASVHGARDDAEARAVARSVISSSLVKAAAHGRDPNWGRIAGAAGNAGSPIAAVLEAGGLDPGRGDGPRRARPPTSTRTGCASRSPAISSSTARRAARSPSIAPRLARRWRPRRSSSAWTSVSATAPAKPSAATSPRPT